MHSYSSSQEDLAEPSECNSCGLPRYRLPNGRPRCRPCDTARAQRYHAKNNDKHKERVKQYYYKSKGPETPIFHVFHGCNGRCHNPKHPAFAQYGKKGISVYPEWRYLEGMDKDESSKRYDKFRSYIVNTLGYPFNDSYSLDRIDVYGNYAPGNIRWANRKTQNDNMRRNQKYDDVVSVFCVINYLGKNLSILEFSKLTGIHSAVVRYRYAKAPGDSNWILSANDDNRYYKFLNNYYNKQELIIITGYSPAIITKRLEEDWPIFELVAVPEEFHYKEVNKPEDLSLIIEDHPVVYNDKKVTLKEFSDLINMPISVVIYRHRKNQAPDQIAAKTDARGLRRHHYRDHVYTTTELAVIAGVSTGLIDDRINKRGWSVEQAMNTLKFKR